VPIRITVARKISLISLKAIELTPQEIIKTWCDELLAPNDADVLVNVHDGKHAVLLAPSKWNETATVTLEPTSQLKGIVKKQKEFEKEAGVDSLGISNYVVHFELAQKAYQSPLLIVDAQLRYKRITNNYELEQVGDPYINPYLAKLLGMSDQLVSLEDIEVNLKEIGLRYTLSEGVYLANFHPHRFVLLKELEQLLAAENNPETIRELLGGKHTSTPMFTDLHEGTLFSVNNDQLAVFETLRAQHCVIQGPPGTGKSQVIANLIGKSLGNELKILVVAEKVVALEVLYHKLKEVGLHHYCWMQHHQLKSKALIESLKNTWHFLEGTTSNQVTYHQHAELLEQGLDLTLQRLQQKDLIGGVDFSTFKELTKTLKLEDAAYASEIPSIPQWAEDRSLLLVLEQQGFPIFGAWRKLKATTEPTEAKTLQQAITRAKELLREVGLAHCTLDEFHHTQRLATAAHLFFYDDTPIQEELLTKKRVQTKFFKLFNDYRESLEKEQLLLDEKKLWKDDFTLTQLMEYIAILSKNDRFSLRFWKTKKELARLSNLSMQDAQHALQRLVELKEVQRSLVDIKKELHTLRLDSSLQSLEQIKLLLQKLTTLDENRFQEILALTIQQRFQLKQQGPQLQEINRLLHTYFELSPAATISSEFDAIHAELSLLVAHSSQLLNLSKATRKLLLSATSLDEATSVIYHSHWRNFQALFPDLAHLDSSSFKERIVRILETQQQERHDFAEYLHAQIANKFHHYHALLQTPANKLSETEKTLKKRLRKGKSILVKEFGKSRSFLSPLELLSSDAAVWMDVLKPILMGSPHSIAKSIPFEPDVFDVVIFDEASQIPLPHALGSIARAKKVAVAGDEQQMAPSFYFKKGVTQAADLLHQVSYYWKNCFLKHHYRSVHPDLISFSNRYFYENQLLAYPSYGAEKPIELITTDGIYAERVNQKEAQAVAALIEEKVAQKTYNFGVVAFSQAQLDAIIKCLTPTTQQLLYENESNELFFKSLENVQGDECDHLIISLGYGHNQEGRFSMQFGPLNKVSGHRRLNVLMSRARIAITFFRSVQSTDFSISENDGVELLRKLMLHLENISERKSTLDFPYGLNYTQKKEELTVLAPQKNIPSALALVNLHAVLKQRGWKLTYRF